MHCIAGKDCPEAIILIFKQPKAKLEDHKWMNGWMDKREWSAGIFYLIHSFIQQQRQREIKRDFFAVRCRLWLLISTKKKKKWFLQLLFITILASAFVTRGRGEELLLVFRNIICCCLEELILKVGLGVSSPSSESSSQLNALLLWFLWV